MLWGPCCCGRHRHSSACSVNTCWVSVPALGPGAAVSRMGTGPCSGEGVQSPEILHTWLSQGLVSQDGPP